MQGGAHLDVELEAELRGIIDGAGAKIAAQFRQACPLVVRQLMDEGRELGERVRQMMYEKLSC